MRRRFLRTGEPPAEASADLPTRRPWPWLFLAVVLVPLALAAVQLCLLTVNRFSTGARLALRSTEVTQPTDNSSLLEGLGLGSGAGDLEQLAAFLRSGDLADQLDRELHLRAHFSDPSIDWWNRLSSDATREDFLDVYADRVAVIVDPLSHTVRIDFQSYQPAFGVAVVEHMVAAAEDFQNHTSQDLARRRLAFLEGQLSTATDRLSAARRTTLAFQTEHGLTDPRSVGEAAVIRIAGLEAALSEARTTMRTQRGFLSAEAAEVQATQARIDAIAAELGEEKAKAIGSDKEALAPLLSRYADLLIAQEFAQEAYRILLASTERTRVESMQTATALVQVERPVAGERPAYPRRVYLLCSAAVILAAIWLILRVLLATVREHQES